METSFKRGASTPHLLPYLPLQTRPGLTAQTFVTLSLASKMLVIWFFTLLSFTALSASKLSQDGDDTDKTTTALSAGGEFDGELFTCGSSQGLYGPAESTGKPELSIELEAERLDMQALDDINVHYLPAGIASRLIHECSQLVGQVVSNALQFSWLRLFVFLFLFRYVRLVVHVVAYNRFKPAPVLDNPTFTAKDVTVVIPTVEPHGGAFDECISRVLANSPASILIVTVGDANIRDATNHCKTLPPSSTNIRVLSVAAPSKREQIKRAVAEIQTAITVLCDDTVFWPPTFLAHALAPFEDEHVGIVGTCKRVRRTMYKAGFGLASFWNLCGVMRLERTNFDLAATNAVDGGVSCVSGRTCAVRTRILRDEAFLRAYTAEYIFWGAVGPLNAGDDKWVTRWVLTHGWRARHQNCPEARIETVLGVRGGGPRFRGQCLRWARSSARDNPKMAVRDGLWRRYPWTTYAVLATSLVNYAALYDPLLVYALHRALRTVSELQDGGAASDHPAHRPYWLPLLLLVVWILATKFVRPASHYRRYPCDLVYAPFVILFGYYHSWIKLHALLTCWDISWGTRAGIDHAKPAEAAAVADQDHSASTEEAEA
ncbi:polysaccharide synthase [Diplodia corticola]|uniref:Polysaccharide synthase n=1 Tax=Diplodia corticola TaxID=236234 RepID=A0A1J9R6H3_9PEZI|nr:polysaccharide synthase [Diplodia corticola]OJD35818.1 polysaccharide synthase [Diplodia corticola]